MMKAYILFSLLIANLLSLTWSQTTTSTQQCQIDLAILVDKSGSIVKGENGMENWFQVLDFVEGAIDKVRQEGNSNVALVTFGNSEKILFGLDASEETASDTLATLRTETPNANTNTSSGLYTAREVIFSIEAAGNRPDVPNVVLVLTDGEPTFGLNRKSIYTDESNETIPAIIKQEVLTETQKLKDNGARVLVVGVGPEINPNLLRNMSSNPDKDYFEVDDFNLLLADLEDIIQSTCRVVTTEAPPTDCKEASDIYFMLDSSGSMRESKFKAARSFLADELVPLLGIGGQSRVGMMYYSTVDFMNFELDEYSSVPELQAAIRATPYQREQTNAAASLAMLRDAFASDTRAVRKFAVIFTDGNSNVNSKNTMLEAKLAKEAGIHIISVGVGNWRNDYELRGLASDPYEKNTFFVEDMSLFNAELATEIKELLCNDVDECVPNPCSCNAACEDKIGDYYCSCSDDCVGHSCGNVCFAPPDVVFAIDESGSLDKDKFRLEQDFVRAVASRLNPANSKIGVLKFGKNASMLFNLGEYDNMEDILNGITTSYDRGSTNTRQAIEMASQMFVNSEANKPKVLVLITDGKSADFQDTWEVAMDAREAGIDIVTVGIGSSDFMKELDAISSGMNSNVFRVADFNALPDAVDQVSRRICNNEDECEAWDCADGTGVDRIGYCECDCPQVPSTSGRHCDRACSAEVDIMLLVDSSGSIRNTRWQDVKDFLEEYIQEFIVGENSARFGAAYFSDNANTAFMLNTYYQAQDVITGVQEMKYLGGRTNIAEVLEIAKNDLMLVVNGDRSDVPDYVILYSDGGSNIRETESVAMAVQLREAGATLIVVAIGDQANVIELKSMASYPLERNYFEVPSFNDIKNNVEGVRENLLSGLVAATCDDVNECDDNPCPSQDRCVDLPGMFYCECPIGTSGINCQRDCSAQIDVALVLDLSASMDTIFELIIAFSREFIYGLPSTARLAVVYYSDEARLLFDLQAYATTRERLNALAFSKIGRETNTAAALDLVMNTVFTAENGDAPGSANIAVVLTDGGSSVNREDTADKAQEARDDGIELYTVGFGDRVQMSEVNAIASDPDSEHVVMLTTEADVTTAANTVLDWLCD